ncbi:MAG: hypothetical protein DI634_01180 [Kocuria palustris]|nr:MAG: hypothetical protein DI634_01180 [Kocuria palustris]
MSYQPPHNADRSSPWSNGGAQADDAARDGGPQGPAHDPGQEEAPRYGVRAPQEPAPSQQGVPQYGRYDDGQSSYSAGQPVQPVEYGAGPGAPAQQSYGGYPNQDPYAQGGYQPGRKVKDGKGMGIASLVLGIVSVLLFWLLGLFIIAAVIGLILGIVSLVRASKARAGKGFGIAGVILNGLGILINGVVLVFSLILGASMISLFNDPDARACIDTYMSSEVTTQDQADFEQCLNDAVDQQLDEEPATAS